MSAAEVINIQDVEKQKSASLMKQKLDELKRDCGWRTGFIEWFNSLPKSAKRILCRVAKVHYFAKNVGGVQFHRDLSDLGDFNQNEINRVHVAASEMQKFFCNIPSVR